MRQFVLLSLIAACGSGHPAGAADGAMADTAAGSGFVHAAGQVIVDGAAAPLELRCVNLGGWLEPEPYLFTANLLALLHGPQDVRAKLLELVGGTEADTFWQAWESTYVTEADFLRIAALGFNCVRLPIDAKQVGTINNSSVALDDIELAAVDRAVAWGGAHGVYVIIDMHDSFGGANYIATTGDEPASNLFPQLWVGPNGEYPSASAAANQQLMATLWGQLAQRYANNTAVAGYDLINEPELNVASKPSQTPVPQSDLVAYETSVTAAIRAVDAHHLVFIEGDSLATDFTPFTAPIDANSAYSFHAYAVGSGSPWIDPTAAQTPLDPLLAMSSAQDLRCGSASSARTRSRGSRSWSSSSRATASAAQLGRGSSTRTVIHRSSSRSCCRLRGLRSRRIWSARHQRYLRIPNEGCPTCSPRSRWRAAPKTRRSRPCWPRPDVVLAIRMTTRNAWAFGD